MSPNLKTCFWYPQNLGSALKRYSEIFGDDFILANPKLQLGDNTLMDAEFTILGHELRAMAFPGGAELNYSSSLVITCDGQDEVDFYWNALLANGGQESQCGWLVDPFGLSWQIVPAQLLKHLTDPNPELAAYAMQAMLKMQKIVIADLAPR